MSRIGPGAHGIVDASATAPPGEEARLRQAVQQLEGVFVQELFKAMRATVPAGEGAFGGGAGEDIFTGLIDQELASQAPAQWERGLSAALYRQLRGTSEE